MILVLLSQDYFSDAILRRSLEDKEPGTRIHNT
jgi:hypothetical protein